MSRCFRAQLASLREWCRNVKEISSTLVTLKHRKIINASYKQSTKTVRNKSYVYQISVWDFFQIFALPGQIPVFFHGFGNIFFFWHLLNRLNICMVMPWFLFTWFSPACNWKQISQPSVSTCARRLFFTE